MTAADRLAAIADRAEGRSLPADMLGRALLTFGEHGRLPNMIEDLGYSKLSDQEAAAGMLLEIREAVLDAEECLFLALGGSPDSPWLAAVDLCRDGGSDYADSEIQRMAGGWRGRWPSVLAQLRHAFAGVHDVRVV